MPVIKSDGDGFYHFQFLLRMPRPMPAHIAAKRKPNVFQWVDDALELYAGAEAVAQFVRDSQDEDRTIFVYGNVKVERAHPLREKPLVGKEE